MSKANPLLLVRDFTLAFGQEWKSEPGLPSAQTAMLRVQLVMEELGELAHALAAMDKVEAVDALTDIDYVTYGAMGAFGTYSPSTDFVLPQTMPHTWGNLPMASQLVLYHEIAKAANMCTMAMSMAMHPDEHNSRNGLQALLFGLPLILLATANTWNTLGLLPYREAAFLEVQRANMSKLGVDGKPIINEAGRVVKGPNYLAPDLARVVAEIDAFLSLETPDLDRVVAEVDALLALETPDEEEVARGDA